MREMVHKHSTLHTLAFAFAAISLGMLLFHHPVEAKEKKVEFAIATFAGGCFWCLEPPFHDLNGVVDVVAGYSGGGKADPSYKEVTSGKTGHVESVQITYDPKKITYEKLLDTFWRQIDPTDDGGQFADRGSQYRTAILFHSEDQKKLAEISKKKIEEAKWFDRPIRTQILPYKNFYRAEDYHQDYYKKNPEHYKMYKYGSGRETFIQRVWGKI